MVEPRTAKDKDCVTLQVQIHDSRTASQPSGLSIGEKIVSIDNMLDAWHLIKARHEHDCATIRFDCALMQNIARIRSQLLHRIWKPDRYHSFLVYEPKERLINAPGIENRLVQQMWALVCEPVFERIFVDESYACRKGKGQTDAVRSLQRALRSMRYADSRYIVKLDFRHYFKSIPHETARRCIRERIDDDLALWIADTIIDSYNPGFPIGSLLSQLVGNIVLDKVDHYMKDELGAFAQGRYMDDIWFEAETLERAEDMMDAVARKAWSDLGLEVNGNKCKVLHIKRSYQFSDGVDFCGCVVHPYEIYVRNASIARSCRRIRKVARRVQDAIARPQKLVEQLASFNGMTAHKDRNSYERMAYASTIRHAERIVSQF
ncbi:MAG: reverse transcriptase/maturase family protein [Sphaerochaetaceae bacterium]|nr:reverse transcriptase/maturase family protein [Spirochaetales bacterium]MDY5500683.1 reverse transcriptase/maturase family protein [Sphaerochaetaceae bacterium]